MKKDEAVTVPIKPWWEGDQRVEKFMAPVRDAIARHLPWPSAEFTDIYNRAYEAVYNAIKEAEAAHPSARQPVCADCGAEYALIGTDAVTCAICGSTRRKAREK